MSPEQKYHAVATTAMKISEIADSSVRTLCFPPQSAYDRRAVPPHNPLPAKESEGRCQQQPNRLRCRKARCMRREERPRLGAQ